MSLPTPGPGRGHIVVAVIGTVIALNVLISIAAIRHAKRIEAPARECALEKWRWVGALEDLEWNLHRWEMLAPACLERGVPIIEKLDRNEGYRIWSFETSQATIQDSTTTTLMVPSAQSFLSGQTVWICGEGQNDRATITAIALAGPDRTALTVEFASKDQIKPLPKGTLLAQAVPVEYRLAPRKDGSTFSLMSQAVGKPAKPIFSGISSFSVSADSRMPNGQTPVTLQVKADQCELTRSLLLTGTRPNANQGQWLLAGESISFSPWVKEPASEEK